jgi:hypothetical protein
MTIQECIRQLNQVQYDMRGNDRRGDGPVATKLGMDLAETVIEALTELDAPQGDRGEGADLGPEKPVRSPPSAR